MKATINKSRLMKEAHKMYVRDMGLTYWSICLKLAWSDEKKRAEREYNEKRAAERIAYNKEYRRNKTTSIMDDMLLMGDAIISFYSTGGYKGD